MSSRRTSSIVFINNGIPTIIKLFPRLRVLGIRRCSNLQRRHRWDTHYLYLEHQMKQTSTPLLWTSFMDIPWGRGSWLSFTSSCLLAPRREIPHALKLIAIARATMKGSNSTPSFETPLQRGVCSPQLVGINFESLNINLCYYAKNWSFYCKIETF